MVPFFVFVSGVAVGIGACKLYDVLKKSSDNLGPEHVDSSQSLPFRHITQTAQMSTVGEAKLEISALDPIMKQYGVDITAPNCLYILCNQIKSSAYKRLLNDIIKKTNNGNELISFINNIHIETFTYPNTISSKASIYIPITTIDQLLAASTIVSGSSDPKLKVETLINSAYASAIDRLKKCFGVEFGKLIKAYEEGRELQSYYNDIINEIKISKDFLAS